MASYSIAVEPDGKTYRLVKVTSSRLVVIWPRPRLVKEARCTCLDDILNLEDYDNVIYSPDYDELPAGWLPR